MCILVRRSLIGCIAASLMALAFAASAEAVSSRFTIGANTSGLPSQPAVAVDSTGVAYIA
jgi:hypothetical protein